LAALTRSYTMSATTEPLLAPTEAERGAARGAARDEPPACPYRVRGRLLTGVDAAICTRALGSCPLQEVRPMTGGRRTAVCLLRDGPVGTARDFSPEKREEIAMFRTIVHPTDFDEPSKEAFRVARSLAGALGARVVVFHIVPRPAIVTQDGRVILNPHDAEPIDLWAEYRTLQADTPKVHVQYAVVVGDKAEAKHLLEEKVRELGEGVLLAMGSHGRRGIGRLLWGSKAEEVVRECPCPVLVVKAPSPQAPAPDAGVEATASA
jgi:nucleotide-binding universal stress UspA family protein